MIEDNSKRVNTVRRSKGKLRLPKIQLGRRSERGQAIVLIALTLVLLIGMAALAIDGGGVLFLRRDAQNAADAAAIAASRADCATQLDEGTADEDANNAEAVAAGIEAAMLNGFWTGHNNSNAKDVTVVVEVSPDQLPPGADPDAEPENYTVATIYATKPSYFSHLLFKDALTVMAVAVSECKPAAFREGAKAIVGFGDICENPVDSSSSDFTLSGGIGSAGDCDFTGSTGSLDEGACPGGLDHEPAWTDPTPVFDPNADAAEDPLSDIYVASDWSDTGIIGKAATFDTCADADPAAVGDSCYHNFDPDGATVLEGIYYWDGNSMPGDYINFTGSGVLIGPKGATIVVDNPANGKITLKNFEPCPLGTCSVAATKVQAYQISDAALAAYKATLSDPDDIRFVNSIYRQANWLMVHTNYEPSGADQCDVNSGNAGIAFGPFTHEFYGLIYANHSGCTASFSGFTGAFGAVICMKVQMSGSNWELNWDPEVLPPTNARIGISQ